MDQPTQTDIPPLSREIRREDVFCRIATTRTLEIIASDPKPIEQIGFTGVVLAGGVSGDTSAIQHLGIRVHSDGELADTLDLSGTDDTAQSTWAQLEASPAHTLGGDLTSGQDGAEAVTLLQMSVRPIPVVPVNEALLYSTQFREQRELLRSAVFWRKRFDIARHTTNLIHAGEDGLLIYWIDSWLVSVNQNPEEASIDLGSQGSMWLMLGSHRDVHLHGSMLILPAHSAAVVANELAR